MPWPQTHPLLMDCLSVYFHLSFSTLEMAPLHWATQPLLVLQGLASGLGNNSSSLAQIFCVILSPTLTLSLGVSVSPSIMWKEGS